MGYRAIVNVGTEKVPVYQSIPGSEFGRSSAEDLHTAYPHQPPKDLRSRRKKHVAKLKAIVEVKQRSISPNRAPITKFLVKWRNDSGLSEEYVARSNLIPIYGKNDTERARQTLLLDLEYNLKYLAQCKEQNKHPETGAALTNADWEATPWLCPMQRADSLANAAGEERRTDPDKEDSSARVGGARFGRT